MAVSQVDVCNAAIGALGQDVTIASMADASKAAKALNRMWDRVIDYVLGDAPWPFATKAIALSLVADTALGWTYAYDYPNDCLDAKCVCTADGVRFATSSLAQGSTWQDWPTGFDGQADFEVQYGTQNSIIVTDLSEAYLIYVSRVTDLARWSPAALEALKCRLAIEVAPIIASDLGIRLGPNLEQKYLVAKSRAIVKALNESRDQLQPMTPMLAARL